MTLVAKWISPDDKPEVMLVMPDGKVEFAVNAEQLWSAVQRAAKSPKTFTSIHEGRKAADWLGERTEGLSLARQAADAKTRAAIEAYEAKHGVTVCASRKVFTVGLEPRKPAKAPRAAKPTLTQAEIDKMLETFTL